MVSTALRITIYGICAALLATGCKPSPPPEDQERTALDQLTEAHLARHDASDSSAAVNNANAWFGERSADLTLDRNDRGQIEHLGGKDLAYDFAGADSHDAPSVAQAEVFFKPDGFGRKLLMLDDSSRFVHVRMLLTDRGKRHEIHQFYNRLRVYPARAALALDEEGRLTDISHSLVFVEDPDSGPWISEELARTRVREHVQELPDPLWQGVQPEISEFERVLYHFEDDQGVRRFRPSFRAEVVAETGFGGRQEVIVDGLNGDILHSVDKVDYMLSLHDTVERVSGTIGVPPIMSEEVLWRGGDACPAQSDAPIGTTPAERDFDEAKAALCAMETFFDDRGGEFGSADFHPWVDPGDSGIRIGIGATPHLSVGMNSGGMKIHAEGVGRAEIIGHEIAHSMYSSGGHVGFSGSGEDGGAVEEHMCDIMGLIVERRMPLRVEDACLLNDDPDSKDATATLAPTVTPCRGQRSPWRSACQPWTDNGGWCEGPPTFNDKAFNGYDLGYPDGSHVGHGLTHTNLGIGNRVATSLFGPPSHTTSMEGMLIHGIGIETFERLFLASSVRLPADMNWAGYAHAWIDAATAISTGDTSDTVRQTRSALRGVKLWSLPKPVTRGSTMLGDVTLGTRPAVVSLIRTDGVERTYIFYRQSDTSEAVHYIYRDEVAGHHFAERADYSFEGPCLLDGAATLESPAAVGDDQSLFVAWAEPLDEDSSLGVVKARSLVAEDIGEEACGETFTELSTPDDAERVIRGGPALALWEEQRRPDPDTPEEIILCTFPQPFPGPGPGPGPFPLSPLPEVNFDLCNIRPGEPNVPPFPLPEDLTQRLADFVGQFIQEDWVRRAPTPLDPLAPSIHLPDTVAHDVVVSSLLRTRPELSETYNQLMNDIDSGIGKTQVRMQPASRTTAGTHSSLPHIEPPFRVRYFVEDARGAIEFPLGDTRSQLILGFRDPSQRLRVAHFFDPRPTNDAAGDPILPVLATNINPGADPALATVEIGRGLSYLAAVYGVERASSGAHEGLAIRIAEETRGVGTNIPFRSAVRIDEIRGPVPGSLRRRQDFAYIRTRHTPVVTSSPRRLHLFTHALDFPREVADGDPDAPGYDPFPERLADRDADDDHIRYAEITVHPSGEIAVDHERPVRLDATSVDRDRDPTIRTGRAPAVGAAQRTQQRGILRFFQARGSELTIKSRF